MPILSAFFDLDGTLVDNFTAVHKCCNLVQRDLGLPLSDYPKVRATVGGSIVLTMQRLVGNERAPQAVDLYRGYFSKHWADNLYPLPGAEWILTELRRIGVRSAVLTNKNESSSARIMEHLGLGALVDDVIGTQEGDAARGFRKPNPDFTRAALLRMKWAAATTLMVGDSPFDAETGVACGLPTRLVTTGSHSAGELETCRACGIHRDLYDLGVTAFGLSAPAVAG